MIFKARTVFSCDTFHALKKGMEIPFTMLSKKFAPSGALCCRCGGVGCRCDSSGFGVGRVAIHFPRDPITLSDDDWGV